MGITYILAFGKLSFVHVTVDTFSHVIIASARSEEATKDVIQHLFQCFSQRGLLEQIKTDNAPAYTSAAFKRFCQQFSIVHSTGIPYNPQGQAIVEKAHQILKNQIAKLRQGEFKYSSPHHVLHHALFVINHLNMDTQGQTAMMRHWIPEGAMTRPLVKWKNLLTIEWKGTDVLLTCGRGYACVFPQDSTSPVWIPDRLIRHVQSREISKITKTPEVTEIPRILESGTEGRWRDQKLIESGSEGAKGKPKGK